MSEFTLDKYVKVKALEEQGKVCLYVLKPENVGAASKELPKEVAVKTFDARENQDANSNNDQREFDILKPHPNIVHCLGQCQLVNKNTGEPCVGLVMEHCQGDLEHLLKARKKFSPIEAVYIVKQILEGLDYLHSNKIVHRKLQLASILLLTDQDKPDWNLIKVWEIKVKLGGFCHAGNIGGQDKCNESGTNAEMPKDIWSRDPEELEAVLKKFSIFGSYQEDIKAIGNILYELVTGSKLEGPLDPKALSLAHLAEDESFLQFLTAIMDGRAAKQLLNHGYLKECMRDLKEMKHDWQIGQMEKRMEEKSMEIQCLKGQLQQKSDKLAKIEEEISKTNFLLQLDEVKTQVNKAFYNACHDGDLEKMKDALKAGADLEWKNKDYHEFTPLIIASEQKKLDAVSLLLKEGAQIDNTHTLNGSALWYASLCGHFKIVEVLLKNGADVEKTVTWGKTPLMIAAEFGHSSVARLLLEAGAQVEKKDNEGKTALDLAKQNEKPEVKQILEKWTKK